MKRLYFLAVLLLAFSYQSAAIEAFLDHAVFNDPEKGTYIETYVTINSQTIGYKYVGKDQYQGSVEIILIFRQDSGIVMFDKYILNSDVIEDTATNDLFLIDLQRKMLPPGMYSLEARLSDTIDPTNRTILTNSVLVDSDAEKVWVSDLVLLERYGQTVEPNAFSKHGLDLVPAISNWFPTGIKSMSFYAEIYNTSTTLKEDFLVTYSIRKHSRKSYQSKQISDAKVVHKLSQFKKQEPQPVNVILAAFDISEVATGNYFLYLEVRSRKNELVASKHLFFQRDNADIDDSTGYHYVESSFVGDFTEKEIRYCLNTILPIAAKHQQRVIDNVLNGNDSTQMKTFFLNFWESRAPEDPHSAWLDYAKQVEKVNENFSTRMWDGFETDMGRVYLQYGPPNQIFKEDQSPNNKPHQIWRYNTIPSGQTEVMFVFYNKDLVTNNYQLIHSNALGEFFDSRWKDIVYYEQEGDLTPNRFGRDRGIMDNRIER
jgi:GWxTD domain-containing protein